MTITNDTMLVQLTVGQLRDIIDERVREAASAPQASADDPGPLEHGLVNLASHLGLSPEYTSHLVNQGRFNGAVVRRKGSRKISFYPKLLTKLLQKESEQTL